MKFKNLSKLLLVASLSSTALTACSDLDVGLGLGVIGGIIIGDIIDGDHHHHHRPNPPRYDGRRRYSVGNESVTDSNLSSNALSLEEKASLVGQRLMISDESALRLTDVLLRAQAGDTRAVLDLGLDREDLIAISLQQDVKATSLEKLALSLDVDLEKAQEIVALAKDAAARAQSNVVIDSSNSGGD